MERTYTLYRLKRVFSEQLPVFLKPGERERPTPSQLIESAIDARPERIIQSARWRIGNVTRLDGLNGDRVVAFRLGKITKRNQSLFNEKTGDFLTVSQALGPFSRVIVDLERQVCGIQENSRLTTVKNRIAKNLESVLAASAVASQHKIEFDIPPLQDPEKFIQVIQRAARVTSFHVSFNPPNPLDHDEQFEEPFQRFLEKTRGGKGITTVWGSNLDTRPLIRASQAAAKAGNTAGAKIYLSGNPAPEYRSTDEDQPVKVTGQDSDPLDIQQKMIREYERIGGNALEKDA